MPFFDLPVTDKRQLTRDSSVAITLAIPQDLRARFAFAPGQYLTVELTQDGEPFRRNYSICMADSDSLTIGVKQIEGGLVSTWLNTQVQPGDRLRVATPDGAFGRELAHSPADGGKRYLAFAAGSGITPILAMLTDTLREPGNQFTLLYCNKSTASTMFVEQLSDLKDAYPDRFQWINVFSREQQDNELFTGRLDEARCRKLLQVLAPVEGVEQAFICGPVAFTDTVISALRGEGMAAERIHRELFVVDGVPSTAKARRKGKAVDLEVGSEEQKPACLATFILADQHHRVAVPPHTSLLDAGIEAGLDMPFACKAGICSTCMAQVVEGEVEMDVNHALETYEVEQGYVLCCQSFPRTASVKVRFKE